MNRKQWIAVGSASVLGLGIFGTGAVATASTLRFDDVPGQRLDLEGVQPAGVSSPAADDRPSSASSPSPSPTPTQSTDPAAPQVPSVVSLVEPAPAPPAPAPAPAPAQPAPAPAPQHVSANSPVSAASAASAASAD